MPLYINHVFYDEINYDKTNKKYLRERFRNYYEDLVERYGIRNNLRIRKQKYIDTAHLSEYLFKNSEVYSVLKEVDLIMRPIWIPPIDPDYCSYELYIKHHFQLKSNIIDIGDVGSLCQFVCIDLINAYLKSTNQYDIALISLESATKHYFRECNMRHAEINFVGSLCAGNNVQKHGIEIIQVVFDNDPHSLLERCVSNVCTLEIDKISNHVLLLYRDKYLSPHFVNLVQKNHYCFMLNKIDYPISSGFLLYCLNKIMLSKNTKINQYYLIVDEDFESHRMAAVLLKY